MVMQNKRAELLRRTKSLALNKQQEKPVDTTTKQSKPKPAQKLTEKSPTPAPKPSRSRPARSLTKCKSLDKETKAGVAAGQSKAVRKLKYKNIKRINRKADDMSLDKLAVKLTPYSLLDKRDPNEMSPGLFEGHKLNSQCLPATSLALKSRPNKRISKMMPFESSRFKTMIRCVNEDDCMQIDDNLKHVFHQGVLNEDNDTDDSVQLKGVNRNYENLRKALRTYKLRNTARRRLAEGAERHSSKKPRQKLAGMMQEKKDYTDDSYSGTNRPVKNLKRNSISSKKTERDHTTEKTLTEVTNERKDSNSMEEESNSQEIDDMAQETTKKVK